MTDLARSWSDWMAEHGGAPPLDEAVTRLAIEEGSDTSLGQVRSGLDALARGARAVAGASEPDRLARLVHRLFVDEGFTGDTDDYDHPANSCIDQVLVRRKGLPILLSVLTVEVGRRVGLELDGVGFPGHFLVGTRGPSRLFVDPFHAGRVRRLPQLSAELGRQLGRTPDPAELNQALAPTSTRDILLRMCNNLARAWHRRGDAAGALRNADRRVGLRPDIPELVRDRGLMRAQLGQRASAAEDLQHYLATRPGAPDAARVSWQLSMLLT